MVYRRRLRRRSLRVSRRRRGRAGVNRIGYRL